MFSAAQSSRSNGNCWRKVTRTEKLELRPKGRKLKPKAENGVELLRRGTGAASLFVLLASEI